MKGKYHISRAKLDRAEGWNGQVICIGNRLFVIANELHVFLSREKFWVTIPADIDASNKAFCERDAMMGAWKQWCSIILNSNGLR